MNMKYIKLWLNVSLLMFCGLLSMSVEAQERAAATAPPTAKAMAPIDLTGYWVSIISEDWRLRMVTPPKGDYYSAFGQFNPPLTKEGRQVTDNWDPAKD